MVDPVQDGWRGVNPYRQLSRSQIKLLKKRGVDITSQSVDGPARTIARTLPRTKRVAMTRRESISMLPLKFGVGEQLGILGGDGTYNYPYDATCSASGKLMMFNALIDEKWGIGFFEDGSIADLTAIQDGGTFAKLGGCSPNATIIVGRADGFQDGKGSGGYATQRAFRWTQETGFVNLGIPDGDVQYSGAWGCSDNGNAVACFTYGDPARWTLDGGMELLPKLGGSYGNTYGGISADGSRIAGWANNALGEMRATIWDDGVVTDLGLVPEYNATNALGISADGRTVVIQSRRYNYLSYPDAASLYLWTADQGYEHIAGDGTQWMWSGGCNASASIVCGSVEVDTNYNTAPLVWQRGKGLSILNTGLATGHGAARRVSRNGRVIVGDVDYGNGQWGAMRWEAK